MNEFPPLINVLSVAFRMLSKLVSKIRVPLLLPSYYYPKVFLRITV